MAESLDIEKVSEIKTTHNEAYELIKQGGEQTPHEEHEYELVCSVPMKQKKVSQRCIFPLLHMTHRLSITM